MAETGFPKRDPSARQRGTDMVFLLRLRRATFLTAMAAIVRPLQLHGQLHDKGAGPAPDPGPAGHLEHRVDRRREPYYSPSAGPTDTVEGAGRRLDLLPRGAAGRGDPVAPPARGLCPGRGAGRRSGVRQAGPMSRWFEDEDGPVLIEAAARIRAACSARRAAGPRPRHVCADRPALRRPEGSRLRRGQRPLPAAEAPLLYCRCLSDVGVRVHGPFRAGAHRCPADLSPTRSASAAEWGRNSGPPAISYSTPALVLPGRRGHRGGWLCATIDLVRAMGMAEVFDLA